MRHLVWLLMVFPLVTSANSFVGNGGNAGDVELTVTMMQIQEAFKVIASKDGEERAALCKCSRTYERNSLCQPLKNLTDEQAAYCGEALHRQADDILKLNPRIRWTEHSIEVMESGQPRTSEAVANRKTGEITINQKAFRRMKPAERVFLLTHELMHFTDFNGKPLIDEGSVGPFKGEAGAREFINAMSAAASTLQGKYPRQVKSYRAKLHRSQAWKNFWVGTEFGGTMLVGETASQFGFDNYQRLGLTLRYQWTHFGVFAGYRHAFADKTVAGSIKTYEALNIFSLGGTYRIFFSEDPLSFWGQTHLLTHASVDRVAAKYEASEDIPGAGVTNTTEDEASVTGATAGVSWYIPLFWGIWTHVGAAYEYHPYKLPNFNLNYDKNVFSVYGGISYAF